MGNQFYYTRSEIINPMEEETKYQKFTDSFNINLVLRSREIEEGKRIVILNDLHERWIQTPVINKMGKITSYKREKDVFQSEILLEKDDADRFVKLLSIE